MVNSKKIKTISEKVTELITNGSGSESNDSSDEAPCLADFDKEEYQPPDPNQQITEIRKKNIKLLSEQSSRYKGKIASRKDFEVDESDIGQSSDEDDEYEEEAKEDKEAELMSDEEDELAESEEEDTNSDDENSGEEEKEEEVSDEDDSENEESVGATEIISETNRQAEVQKGVSVQNQLRVWEKLLEVRINAQKLLNKTNQLPAPQDLQRQRVEDAALQSAAAETAAKTGILLKTLLELQSALCSQFPEMRGAIKNTLKRPSPFCNGPPPAKRISDHLEAHFTESRSYRNAVLFKWDDRTKLLTPGAGSKKKTSLQEEFDVVRKIENTLMQRSALLEKSQIVKSTTSPTAVDDSELPQRNANVYDDSDFYHQQLRELIEYKANTSANMSEVTKQFVELQKLRQKMKKKVDTRASKGRKLRYVVHNKLINFMAPDDKSTWTLESRDELCKSLFAS